MSDRRDAAITVLFDEQYERLHRLATLLLGDRERAEEAVQEAFLRTFAGWRRVRHPERAAAYLRAAVVNQCRSQGRRRRVEDRSNRTVWAGTAAQDPPAGNVEATGDVLAVVEAVRALPARQRETIVLRYYADLSEHDVAAAMGCSTGTVKSQLAKARATLALTLAGPAEGGAPAVSRKGASSGD